MNESNQKYEITDIAHKEYPFLHRIRALRNIGTMVEAGDLGGFVEGEWNLSHEDADSWIFHDAIAANAAFVEGGSILRDQAVTCGEARIQGGSVLSGYARAEDHACVVGAQVESFARVSGHGMAFAYSPAKAPLLTSSCVVHGNVAGNVCITGKAVVLGDEKIANESIDRLIVDEKGRRINRSPERDRLLPSAQYFGKSKPKHKHKEVVR